MFDQRMATGDAIVYFGLRGEGGGRRASVLGVKKWVFRALLSLFCFLFDYLLFVFGSWQWEIS